MVLNKENEHHYIVCEQMTDWGLPNKHLRAEVDPETVCQYTGLTDKNGRKIFEGDIIKQESKFSGEQPFYHVVEYTEEYKMFTTDLQLCGGIDCPLNIYLSLDLCEVIGNIFDNPELIGGKP